MPKVDIEFTGFDELIQKIDKLAENPDQHVEKGLQSGGKILKEAMINNAPERTGRLKETIELSGIQRDTDMGRFVRVGDLDRELHYFWQVNALRPFVEKSKKQTRRKVEKEVVDSLTEEVAKILK